MAESLRCVTCSASYPAGLLYRCDACGGELELIFEYARAAQEFTRTWMAPGSIWDRFRAVLPTVRDASVISLGEGSTPLVRSRRTAARLGLERLYFKLEYMNPTGSFKDRQVSVAITKAADEGAREFAVVSSGNVGVALSAYCARAGFDAEVWVSVDVAESKRLQISMYGAQVKLLPPSDQDIERYFAAYTGMQRYAVEHGKVPMVSARPVNPFMVEGGKTIAFEIAAALEAVPEHVFCCVGGGGLLGGVYKGFRELVSMGLAQRTPRISGGQVTDRLHAPIHRLHDEPFRSGSYYRPLDGAWAWQSIQSSGGEWVGVTMEEVYAAQQSLAFEEGVFAEPQGAYALAALSKCRAAGKIAPDETVVCTVTGSGLKDMKSAARFRDHPLYREPVETVLA
ncbi:MAG: pyridoxal-phosphate dependent enzyme [bacterium]|nr:pyridoxal-phosphate dependent enzyme [bacterium]